MTRLSVVVFRDGQDEPFEETLASVLQFRPEDCQILAVYAGRYDDPYSICDEVDLIGTPAGSSLSQMLNAGLTAARGDVLHVLGAGLVVNEGWCEPALRQMREPGVAMVAPLIADRRNPARAVLFGVDYGAGGRRIPRGLNQRLDPGRTPKSSIRGPSLTAGFYDRAALACVEGFDETIGDSLCDIDLALALECLGFEARFEPQCRIHSERNERRASGSFRTGAQHERLFFRYLKHVGIVPGLLGHLPTVAGQALRDMPRLGCITQLLGRLTGCLALPDYLRQARRLRQARERHRPRSHEAAPSEGQAVVSRAA